MKPASVIWPITFLSWILACIALPGQIVIYEFMSSNRSITADEDGHYEDWIELKNTGASSVNLAGYGLTDDLAAPFKWVFPSTVIPAGGIITVWASGKDRKGLTPQTGLLREVYLGIAGGSVEVLEGAGNFPDFPDSSEVMTLRFDAPRDFGDSYGQRISGFLIPTQSGNYDFRISADNGSRLFLSNDADPANARAIAEVPADRWSNPETYNTFSSQSSAVIPLTAGRMYYMAALMKEDTGGDHLSVQWRRNGSNFSRTIIPASSFIVKPSVLHTNFKLSAEGEPLRLTRPDGSVASQMPAIPLPVNVSFGRSSTQPGVLEYFSTPTRGAENAATGFSEILEDVPVFSREGGLYDESFQLSLGGSGPDTQIIFTLDGSIPDPANLSGKTFNYRNQFPNGATLTSTHRSFGYSSPIQVRNRSTDANNLSMRATTYWNSSSYVPSSSVFKGTVVRARVIQDGALPGPVVTQTYFVSPGIQNRYQLPVISLSMNEEALFGYEKGLYTAGRDYDQWRAFSTFAGNGGTPANYKRRGALAEHPAHFEMFRHGQGRVVSQGLGFRMHGGWSRAWPQKSLRLYAGSEYDALNVVDSPLIPGLLGRETGKPVASFQRFVLRNSGNDHEQTRVRDAFINALNKPLNLDQQGFEPAVHFINGEYWGLINIRERIDRFFIASHHGVDPGSVAILSNNAEISEGTARDRDDFLKLREFIAANNMADPAVFAHVAERMDIDNFIRYNVAQIYANNRDWPHNNIDVWRASIPGLPANVTGTSDGRWRWILFDTDFGFGLSGGADINTLDHATRFAGGEDWSTVKLRRLLSNPGFRNQFINTFADHMASSYKSQVVNSLVDTMQARINPYFTEHRARWRTHGDTSTAPIKNFGSSRPGFMRQHILSRFGLPGVADVALNTPDASRGSIQINSITINSETPGLANPSRPYPWIGSYFRNVPVTLTAKPAPGFRFAGWLGMPEATPATLTVVPGVSSSVTALFEEAPTEELVHYWNFNVSDLLSPTMALLQGSGIELAAGGSSSIVSGTGQDFTAENARSGNEAGSHLRLNDPLGAILELSLPTNGHEALVLQYETRRSGQGAGVQSISYAVDGGGFLPFRSIVITETPTVHRFNFTGVAGVDDNAEFKVRVTFSQGGGGIAGNNRFDNLTLDGRPIPGANQPPMPIAGIEPLALIEGSGDLVIDLATWFEDADGDELEFNVVTGDASFASAVLDGALLTLRGTRRGETRLTVTADDGALGSAPVEVDVLIHPAAHRLADAAYVFDEWSPDAPQLSFPEHMIFLQGTLPDPGVTEPLTRAYSPGADAHLEDDSEFPYSHARRTRINGLGPEGISFINTGRDRDLGGAVLALDTRGLTGGNLRFVAQTLAANEREYALRLQYRVGLDGEFMDVPQGAQPVVYPSSALDGDLQVYEGIALPGDALGQEYVQFLWRYHHVSGDAGTRPEIRLDDIVVSPGAPVLDGFALWQQENFPGIEDPAISGADADPFGWGVTNLMRYALDIADATDLATQLPRLDFEGDGGSPRFGFPLDSGKPGLVYQVEGSPDLQEWGPPLFDSREPDGNQPVDGWLSVEIPQGGTDGYFRLKVSLVEPAASP